MHGNVIPFLFSAVVYCDFIIWTFWTPRVFAWL